ncbi:fimbrial biogenesis outer membrane usher protein, partial [Acinetobacter gerneri]
WTQSLGRYALLDVNAAGSSAYGNDGYSVGASVSNSFDSFSMGLSTRYSSEDYQSLGYTQDFRNPRIDSLAYLSFFKVPYVNSVNLNYVERRYYPDDEV